MTSESLQAPSGPTRRTVVAAVGVTGASVALSACGSGDGGTKAAASGTVLAKTSDIPEGGGKILPEHQVVVTQPTAGSFKAFSSKCTHQGCAVSGVRDGVISCPCHHSEFSIADGSVKKSPATRPLPEVRIAVSGTDITLA
ncbi:MULTISPECIES: Rieske (2Fe-2S) protein [unclassified Streptomyces]|uniref:Rieske (2Fe-2S) protein n=1 Tax=unclassified Streptomyces TaxID=2593676 RepID=UPI00342F36DA